MLDDVIKEFDSRQTELLFKQNLRPFCCVAKQECLNLCFKRISSCYLMFHVCSCSGVVPPEPFIKRLRSGKDFL